MVPSPTPTAETAIADQPCPTATAGSRSPHPIALGLISGLLLWLAFPPADLGYLAWIALVPLFLLVPSDRPRWSLYLGAWIGGLVFSMLAVEWVRRTDPSAWLAWVLLGVYLSLYWPAFLGLARAGVRRWRLPPLVVLPSVWVGLEFVRAFALTGFPWLYLAHTQYRNLPLIQCADLVGVWGPSLLVALVNAWLVVLLDALRTGMGQGGWRPAPLQVVRTAVVVLLVGAAWIYGLVRIHTAHFRPGPRVALLQSNFKQELKSSLDPEQIIAVYRALMSRAVREHAELIVWPETAFPYYGTEIAPELQDPALEQLARRAEAKVKAADVRRRQRIVGELLHGITDWAGVPVVFGVTVIDYRVAGRLKYNSSVLVEPKSARRQRYDKLHLVPFGEYVPLLETFPWLTRLTPYHGDLIPSLAPGTSPSWLRLGSWKFASAICFEDSLPFVVRRSFAEVTDGHAPDVILNISNDGWFRGSSELDMHLAVSVFRAVENRVPLARAVNTGISAIIDGNGAIRSHLPKLTEGALVGIVPLDDRDSVYIHAGDWLGALCLVATIMLFFPSLRILNRLTGRSVLPNSP